ncbi:MAG: hypothetical protein COB56_01115 [Robiginitomaculum sp.]|nr:MAG: hypothetical protein COB56_01115 [Robiginitomaculum sp.]
MRKRVRIVEKHYFTGFKTKLEKIECWVMGKITSFAHQTRSGLWVVVIAVTKTRQHTTILIERYKQEAIWLLRLYAAQAIKTFRRLKREQAILSADSDTFMHEALGRYDRRVFVPAPSYFKKPKATKPTAYGERTKAYAGLEF